MKLKDRVTVVLGAAGGVGRALSFVLGGEGAKLILLDRDHEGLELLATELQAQGVFPRVAPVDLCDRESLQGAIHAHAANMGAVDLLVACNGAAGITLVDDLRVEELVTQARMNYLSVVYAVDAVVPQMIERQQGQIVAVSGVAAVRGLPFLAGYSASKAALSSYLESLRPALSRRGIRVTTVCPGLDVAGLNGNCPLQFAKPTVSPDQAARHILRAVLRRRRFYCFPWLAGLTTRYLRLMPTCLFDWQMARRARKVPLLRY